MAGFDYKSSGVDRALGDDASRVLYEAAKLTWENRKGKLGEVVEIFPDFSGLRAIHVGGLPADSYLNLSFDGVGTKVELGERIAKHDTIAYDLFAMVCDDAVVRGAEPVVVGSILDVRSLGEDQTSYLDLVKQLAVGYVDAAHDANVAVVNGEVAELGASVHGYTTSYPFLTRVRHASSYLFQGDYPPLRGFQYIWGAGVVWFARKSRLLTGYDIKEGDALVGLREHGFRSNGLSLVRRIMKAKHGAEWHRESYEGKSLAALALHPSTIYSAAVVAMLGGFAGEPGAEVHGVSHITGGGIPGKLGRTLRPTGLGAMLDDPFEPAEIMSYCQDIGDVSDAEAYRSWNMGQGMIIVTPCPQAVMKVAKEHGIESKVIGEVTKGPAIRIRNKGINAASQKELVFSP